MTRKKSRAVRKEQRRRADRAGEHGLPQAVIDNEPRRPAVVLPTAATSAAAAARAERRAKEASAQQNHPVPMIVKVGLVALVALLVVFALSIIRKQNLESEAATAESTQSTSREPVVLEMPMTPPSAAPPNGTAPTETQPDAAASNSPSSNSAASNSPSPSDVAAPSNAVNAAPSDTKLAPLAKDTSIGSSSTQGSSSKPVVAPVVPKTKAPLAPALDPASGVEASPSSFAPAAPAASPTAPSAPLAPVAPSVPAPSP